MSIEVHVSTFASPFKDLELTEHIVCTEFSLCFNIEFYCSALSISPVYSLCGLKLPLNLCIFSVNIW